jgi:hypothetical protein
LNPEPTDTVNPPSNKAIYTLIRDISAFSSVEENAAGCIWNIETIGGTFTIAVPSTATDYCEYSDTPAFNSNDAYQVAVYNLLSKVDVNGDGVVDINLDEGSFDVDYTEVTGIPFRVKALMEVRTWN